MSGSGETETPEPGQPQIEKRGWTEERYERWFVGLRRKRTPRRKPQDFFEIEHTGPLNYLIRGGGEELWADGIDAQKVLEAKMVVTPRKSPFIEGAGRSTPAFIKENIVEKVRGEGLGHGTGHPPRHPRAEPALDSIGGGDPEMSRHQPMPCKYWITLQCVAFGSEPA